MAEAKDSNSKSNESYFPSLSSIKTDDEHSYSEGEDNDEAHSIKQKDENLSSSPTAAESEHSADLPNQNGGPPSSFARLFAYGLVGMTIDYNGDILDSAKRSRGKASGDITEMVGQKIDEDGLIRSTAGEAVGQVAQNYGLQEAVAAMLEAQKRMEGGGNRTSNGTKHTRTEERERKGKAGAGAKEGNQDLPNIWKGTVGEGAPGNDIHLNVQSTKEGISMSIRIPTMFMKEQARLFEEEKNAAREKSG